MQLIRPQKNWSISSSKIWERVQERKWQLKKWCESYFKKCQICCKLPKEHSKSNCWNKLDRRDRKESKRWWTSQRVWLGRLIRLQKLCTIGGRDRWFSIKPGLTEWQTVIKSCIQEERIFLILSFFMATECLTKFLLTLSKKRKKRSVTWKRREMKSLLTVGR